LVQLVVFKSAVISLQSSTSVGFSRFVFYNKRDRAWYAKGELTGERQKPSAIAPLRLQRQRVLLWTVVGEEDWRWRSGKGGRERSRPAAGAA
jgi:hypothetical protein